MHRLEVKHVSQDLGNDLSIPQHIWNYSATMREELHKINQRRPITAVEAPIWDTEGIAPLLDGSFPLVLSLHTTLGIWLETHDDQRNDEAYMRDFGAPMLALERFMSKNRLRSMPIAGRLSTGCRKSTRSSSIRKRPGLSTTASKIPPPCREPFILPPTRAICTSYSSAAWRNGKELTFYFKQFRNWRRVTHT